MSNDIKLLKKKTKIIKLLSKILPIKSLRHKLKDIVWQNKRIWEYKEILRDCNVGEHTYIGTRTKPDPQYVEIGKYCSIAREVKLGLGNHPSNMLTTHPFAYCSDKFVPFYVDIQTPEDKIIPIEIYKKIKIGNDVWIGQRAIILDGVTIGDGAIIGAGAIVSRDIPPYAIAVGSPARVVKYRFPEDIIKELLTLRWWDFPEDFLVNNMPFDNIEKCIEILKANVNLRKG